MKHLLLAIAGLCLALPALAEDAGQASSSDPDGRLVTQSKATGSGSGVGQVPEALKRKVKPTAIVKKPVVVKR